MLLYEGFILGTDEDEGFQTSLRSANEVYSITQRVYAHSQDQVSYYYTSINYCWMVTNRVFLRAMRFSEDRADLQAASAYRYQVEFLLVSGCFATWHESWTCPPSACSQSVRPFCH